MLRELEAQRHEMREIIRQERKDLSELKEENERLRRENARLRAPLGLGMALDSS